MNGRTPPTAHVKAIHVADKLPFPAADAATQVYAFMGRRGSGKTFAAGRLVEELLDAGHQVVVLDPVGVWYGLRLAKDGHRPGFPIPVLGGQHGDIPLSPAGGATVAKLVATRALSAVLDVSELTGSELHRFVADFATELLHAKKRARSALMVVFEEAQEMVPQHVRGDLARMVGAVEKLVKLGRNFGVGTTLISQRPQAVNKDVLNQTEAMLCFQLSGPQERKAIAGWIREKGAGDRDVQDELPSLPRGVAMVWSPQWLGTFGRYSILPKRTYDASATPDGTSVHEATLAPIDLAELRSALAAAEDADSDHGDPRAEVARLRKELARARDLARAVRVEQVPFVPPQAVDAARAAHAALVTATDQLAALMRVLQGVVPAGSRERGSDAPTTPAPVTNGHRRAALSKTPEGERKAGPGPDQGKLPAGARAILRALAERGAPLTRVQVATLAGLAPTSGTTANYLSLLATRGLIRRDGPILSLTDAGAAAVGPIVPVTTPRQLVNLWRGRLSGKAKEMLELLAAEGGPLTKAEIAERVQLVPDSGTFANYLSQLRSNNLVEKSRLGYVINPALALPAEHP